MFAGTARGGPIDGTWITHDAPSWRTVEIEPIPVIKVTEDTIPSAAHQTVHVYRWRQTRRLAYPNIGVWDYVVPNHA